VTDPRSQILSLSPHVSSGQHIGHDGTAPQTRSGREAGSAHRIQCRCLWTQRDRPVPAP
jgi:hypothetical protein